MAKKKISQMTVATALTGAEIVPVLQGAGNKKTTTQAIADLNKKRFNDIHIISSADLDVNHQYTLQASDIGKLLVLIAVDSPYEDAMIIVPEQLGTLADNGKSIFISILGYGTFKRLSESAVSAPIKSVTQSEMLAISGYDTENGAGSNSGEVVELSILNLETTCQLVPISTAIISFETEAFTLEKYLLDKNIETVIELGTITYLDYNAGTGSPEYLPLADNPIPANHTVESIIIVVNESFEGTSGILPAMQDMFSGAWLTPESTGKIQLERFYQQFTGNSNSAVSMLFPGATNLSFLACFNDVSYTNPQDYTTGSWTFYAIVKPFPI